jgi:dephospho-CoA kinase
MLRVGLTGGIGSGKSTVAALLREWGAVVTDADRVAREVVEPGMPSLSAIAARFGPTVIRSDGTLDRAALAGVVFPDPEALRVLEAITGPAINARVGQLRGSVPAHRIDVYDMPLLVEKGLWVHDHLTVVVGADADIRVDRLVSQRGLSEGDARARIAAQANDVQRRAAADAWIDNGGTHEATEAQVRRLWDERLVPYDRNLRDGIRARRPDTPTLTEADQGWGDAGARVVARLAAGLAGQGIRVDHIGSTSVAGLVAKDVIDVQIGVRSLTDADAGSFEEAMRRVGYLGISDHVQDHFDPAGTPLRDWQKQLFAGCDPGRIVHVHVREIGSAGWEFALAFRDWLRSEPAAREEYAALKRQLAAQSATTRNYTDAKEPWFETAYPRVQEWIDKARWTP